MTAPPHALPLNHEGPAPGRPDGYLLYLLKQVEVGLRRHFIDIMATHDMTYAEYTSLTVLQARPGLTSAELARRSFVRPQSMSETVASLIETGSVARARDPEHGRRILLFITPTGDQRVAAVRPAVRRLEESLTEELGEAQQDDLEHSLRLVRLALMRLSADEDRPMLIAPPANSPAGGEETAQLHGRTPLRARRPDVSS